MVANDTKERMENPERLRFWIVTNSTDSVQHRLDILTTKDILGDTDRNPILLKSNAEILAMFVFICIGTEDFVNVREN